jgi:hypothetical protein
MMGNLNLQQIFLKRGYSLKKKSFARIHFLLLVIVMGLLFSGCSYNRYHSRGLSQGYPQNSPSVGIQVNTPQASVSMVFGDRERRIIGDYYKNHTNQYKKSHWKGKGKRKGKGLPPGLAKKGGHLPPGLAKKGHLPPGIRKKMLPRDLITQLPPPSPGTEVIIYNNQVALVEINTNIVLDIIDLSVSMQF